MSINWSALLGILAGTCLAEMLAFMGLYAGRSAWRSQPEGVALMGLFGILGSIFAMFLVGRIVGGLGLPTWCAAFAVFAVVLAVWLVLLVRAQRKARR